MTTHGDDLVGQVLDGRYRVLRHLADGGMARVWVGLDERLERQVAIKVLRPHLHADAAFVRRFEQEARAAARLNHPGIVAVHDAGEDHGRLYLVMELVEGHTLRQIVRDEAPLTPRAALDILIGLLSALAHAHAQNLIHRDVKPENVILRESDGTVKVTDFGLARAVSSQTMTSGSATLLGTVAYLAPEQVEFGRADMRSDVYASGLVLYEMLTGCKAFEGDAPISVAYQHVHGEVPAPSAKVPELPQEMDDLVALATAKDPDDRPADAAEYLHEVCRVREVLTAADLDLRPHTDETTRELSLTRTAALPLGRRPTPRRSDEQTAPGDSGAEAGAATGALAGSPAGAAPTVNGGGDSDKPDGAGAPGAAPTGAHAVPMTSPGEPAPNDLTDPAAGVQPDPPSTGIPAGEPGESPPARSRWWRRAAILVLAATLLGVGGSYGWRWYDAEFGAASLRTVPAVVNLPQAQARAAIEGAELRVQVADPQFSETVPADAVISADPADGQLRKESTVTLVLSKGPERYNVPQLVGLKQDAAQAALTDNSLTVGSIDQQFSETIPEGVVIAQSLKPGTPSKKGTPVALSVSKGRQPIAVTNLAGTPFDSANKQLSDLGLKVVRAEDVFSTTLPAGIVVSQNPASGTLYKDDKVTLVVSKGPEKVAVPKVVGMSTADATAALKKAGFAVTTKAPIGVLLNRVQNQSVPGGTLAPVGSTIVLTIV